MSSISLALSLFASVLLASQAGSGTFDYSDEEVVEKANEWARANNMPDTAITQDELGEFLQLELYV